MTKSKIDPIELQRLYEQGKSQTEIARYFGVNQSSVHKALKKNKLAITRRVTLEIASQIANNKMDALQQLNYINQTIVQELDWIKGKLHNKCDVEMKRFKDRCIIQNQMVKLVAEIRKQINTQIDIFRALYNFEEVKAFQEIVLSAINDAAPDVREKIIKELQQKKAIGSAVDIQHDI